MRTADIALDVHSPPASARPGGDRHVWLDEFCTLLGQMGRGKTARHLLDEGPADGAVVALPMWSWAYPGVDVGRKAFDYAGVPVRLPVRLDYEHGLVMVIPAATESKTAWTGAGLGLLGAGSIVFGVAGMDSDDLPELDAPLPAAVRCHFGTAGGVVHDLTALVVAGSTAHWRLRTLLEKYVAKELRAAASRVVGEISQGRGGALDETGLQTLVDQFVYGDQERPGQLDHILGRALDPVRFLRVEPSRWLRLELHRDSERFVRTSLGDPTVGAKVRRVARDLGENLSMESLLDAYHDAYPTDRLAAGRALSALSVSAGPLLRDHSGEDYLLDRPRRGSR